MKKLIDSLLIVVVFSCVSLSEVYACKRIIVRQESDLVSVFSRKNIKLIIEDSINLNGLRIVIGDGSALVFKGGCLSNGTVVGNNTKVSAENYEIFKRGYTRYRAYIAQNSSHPSYIKNYHNCIIIEGTWNNKRCGSNWTGLANNSDEDVMLALRNYIILHKTGTKVSIPQIDALGYEPTKIPGGHQIDFNNSRICYPEDLSKWEDVDITLPQEATPNPLESGYGMFSLESNTSLSNLTIDGKSTSRHNETIRLGASCMIAIGNAQNVLLENIDIRNVLGPGVTAQAGSKDIIFRNCRFYNVGEHIVYSHQYLGFCRFDGCFLEGLKRCNRKR